MSSNVEEAADKSERKASHLAKAEALDRESRHVDGICHGRDEQEEGKEAQVRLTTETPAGSKARMRSHLSLTDVHSLVFLNSRLGALNVRCSKLHRTKVIRPAT